jgi:putative inorganic carbon (hco3(-)) transporter
MATIALQRSTIQENAPALLAGAAAATSTVSIAASQILLGMALLTLLVSARHLFRWPRVAWPLAAFAGWTLVSLAASPDPADGLPQIKKFYVYLMLIVVFSTLRTIRDVRWVVIGWAAGASLSGVWGLGQYVHKYLTTPSSFFYLYSNQRITGFMGHWMTFSGLLMMALLMSGSLLLFSRDRAWSRWLMAACAVIGLGLLTAWTRSMWIGSAAGSMWLLGAKKKRLMALVPVAAGLVLLLNPLQVRDRALTVLRPEKGMFDATSHRAALRAVGGEMVKAHPLVGVGPEQVGPQFLNYLPPEVPNPVPKDWYYQHLHNIYYHYAAERGLPALVALLAFLGWALFDFFRGLRRASASPEARWVLHGAIAAIIAIMISGYFEVNLGDSEVLAMFLSVIACGYVALQAAPEKST